MAFPTRHWVNFNGILAAGGRLTQPHGLVTGLISAGTGYNAPQTLFSLHGVNNGPPNISIGQTQTADATNIYLSNWDPALAHPYSVMVRLYLSDDSRNT